MTNYREFDPELWAAVDREADRQEHNIELIASENIASAGVRAAQGSILTNKYAEVILASVTTVELSLSTKSSNWRLIAPRNCSVRTMPTCNHTQGHKPTQLFMQLCLNMGTTCWGWTSTLVVT